MFRGSLLGHDYFSWESYKNAWNEAVLKGLLFDDKGNKITNVYN